MRKKKDKPEPPKLPPALEAAIAGFVPVFGHDGDRLIAARIHALREAVAKGRQGLTWQAQSLLREIAARNMDF